MIEFAYRVHLVAAHHKNDFSFAELPKNSSIASVLGARSAVKSNNVKAYFKGDEITFFVVE